MVTIYKLTGTGNNFLLIDLRNDEIHKSFTKHFADTSRAKVAEELCNPFQSLGADGLLFLEPSHTADLKWDFYNADGSTAEMCGNAARCVGRYVQTDFTLETLAGVISVTLPQKHQVKAKISSEIEVCVQMPKVKSFKPQLKASAKSKNLFFDFVNSGVPHAVVQIKPFMSLKKMIENVDNLAHTVDKIRALAMFKKNGTNVTFFSSNSNKKIESLTFERGVKGYTQACGTGAVAAAISYTKNTPRFINVEVPGGLLQVDLRTPTPQLIGSAKWIAKINIE